MEPQQNTSKYWIWILVVIVIILAVVLTKRNSDTVSDTLEDLSDDVQECRVRLSDWETKYPQGTSTSPEAQSELDEILKDCEDVVEGASDEL